ncbi:class F sortase [Streptantibioticus silvisoli]|uniref:class F sortase n=1 Tax=Streptantibioticus silvisoli TaxID=2705255 RepID=UPI0027E2A697|nr:class F sortase [Streptantibioticus silvisoli]
MPPGPPGGPERRRGPSKLAVGAAVLALVSGVWLMRAGTETHEPPSPSAADALGGRNAGGPGAASVPAPGAAALPPSLPTRVRIPSIAVDAPVMKLGVDSKNEIQVPPDDNRNMAGWYEYGATPGARGAAVLLGHVDTMKGPAVFYAIGSLHKGNLIEVTRADHKVAVFAVYGVEVYSKSDFPSDKVYDDTPTPEIRVITCGGGFSKTTHSYLGNVVVYAKLTATRTASATASGSSSGSPAASAATAPATAPATSPTAFVRASAPAAAPSAVPPAAVPAAPPAAAPGSSGVPGPGVPPGSPPATAPAAVPVPYPATAAKPSA